jgi:pilus assembly protein CpaC
VSVQRVAALLAVALCGSALAAGEAEIVVEAGSQRRLVHDFEVRQVALGDPAIADVEVIGDRELLLTGKSPGATSLLVWPTDGDVPVERSVRVAPASLARTEVPGDAQVQIDIRVVELSRRHMKQAGVQFGRATMNTTGAVTPPGLLSGVSGGEALGFALESASGFLPMAQAFNLVFGDAGEGLLAVLSILESNGFAHVLAEPTLVALSGQTATFVAGGEFPIPVAQSTSGDGAISVEFKEFGIRLKLTPTVLAPDRIVLKVAPEVSELDFTNAVQTGGVAVPALVTRRADTTVQLGDGESFAIGGLISKDVTADVDKIPFLGDIPVLGAFFRSTRFDREDKELLMIVSPHLVRPIAAGAETPELPGAGFGAWKPGATELFLQETGSFQGALTGFGE